MAIEKNKEKEDMKSFVDGAKTDLAFQCMICKTMYKKPGMCHGCETVMKSGG